jgi:hypothetical protein
MLSIFIVMGELDGPAQAEQRLQRPVIGWVTKIYYLKLLRASEGTLNCWSRQHLQSFVPTSVSRSVVNTIAESLSHHDENMLYCLHLRPKLIVNLNPFLPIRHRNFNLHLCLSMPIMYPHCEL